MTGLLLCLFNYLCTSTQEHIC